MIFYDDLLLSRFRSAANPIQISQDTPIAACFKNLNLVEIPRVMREKNLTVAAQIMEHWFLGKLFVMPKAWKAAPPNAIDPRTISAEHINETIVTMQWALGFTRALNAYSELKRAVTGNLSEKSLQLLKDELFDNLQTDGKFTQKLEQFGFGSARTLHKIGHMWGIML